MSAEATLCAQLPREAQKTLYSVLSRVALPSEADEKYRTLKLDNAALQQRLLRHSGALELLALCRFELRGRTLVLPADASADAIHRALDAITAAASAASVPPAAPAAVPTATAPTPPPPPRREGATAGASPEEIQARAEKRRRAAEADAAARALERRRWAADSAARRDRQAPPAATPTQAAPTPPPPPTSDQRRFRVRLPERSAPVAVAVANDATLDALREAIAAAGVEGAFALVRSLPHRVFDAELPGDAALAALGLDDGLTLVAMPADARGRVVRGSVLAALGNAHGDAADVDGMDYEELLELQERIGTATDERAAAAAALESTTTFEVSEADAAARRTAGGDAARCVVCMEDIAVGDVLRRMAKCPHACHAPCLERWLATNPKCPVCGTV